LTDLRKK